MTSSIGEFSLVDVLTRCWCLEIAVAVVVVVAISNELKWQFSQLWFDFHHAFEVSQPVDTSGERDEWTVDRVKPQVTIWFYWCRCWHCRAVVISVAAAAAALVVAIFTTSSLVANCIIRCRYSLGKLVMQRIYTHIYRLHTIDCAQYPIVTRSHKQQTGWLVAHWLSGWMTDRPNERLTEWLTSDKSSCLHACMPTCLHARAS